MTTENLLECLCGSPGRRWVLVQVHQTLPVWNSLLLGQADNRQGLFHSTHRRNHGLVARVSMCHTTGHTDLHQIVVCITETHTPPPAMDSDVILRKYRCVYPMPQIGHGCRISTLIMLPINFWQNSYLFKKQAQLMLCKLGPGIVFILEVIFIFEVFLIAKLNFNFICNQS